MRPTEFVERVNEAAATSMQGFAERMGYAPDVNEARLRDLPLDTSIEPWTGAADDVRSFFAEVAEVSLPDIWNGYFIGPGEHIVNLWSACEPRTAEFEAGKREVLVLGSDGGGALYVIGLGEGPRIVRFRETGSVNGHLQGGATEAVAATWSDFTTTLVLQLEAFARSGTRPTI